MKHRYERRKPKLRKKFSLGGSLVGMAGANIIGMDKPGFVAPTAPTNAGIMDSFSPESLVSLGSGIANQLSVSNLQTQNRPALVPNQRRDYKSFLGSVQRGIDNDYREGMLQMGNNALDGEMGKSNLLASKLGVGSQASIQDAMQEEQFQNSQDQRQDRSSQINVNATNAMNEANLSRENQKIAARAGATSAFAQEQLDLMGRKKQMTYDQQKALLKAIEVSDTNVLGRAAKQFGYDDVTKFIADFMAGKLIN